MREGWSDADRGILHGTLLPSPWRRPTSFEATSGNRVVRCDHVSDISFKKTHDNVPISARIDERRLIVRGVNHIDGIKSYRDDDDIGFV